MLIIFEENLSLLICLLIKNLKIDKFLNNFYHIQFSFYGLLIFYYLQIIDMKILYRIIFG